MRRLHVLDPCSNRTTAGPVGLEEESLRGVHGGSGRFVQSADPSDDSYLPREPFCG